MAAASAGIEGRDELAARQQRIHQRPSPQRHALPRVGAHGRRGVLSLDSVNAGLVGASGDDWTTVARALAAQGRLSAADAEQVAARQLFGQLMRRGSAPG